MPGTRPGTGKLRGRRLFCLFLHRGRRGNSLDPLACLAGGGGFGGAVAAAVEGALLVAPGGAFAGVDRAVMIDVDLVEPLAEAAVAIGRPQPGGPIVVSPCLRPPACPARPPI